MLNKKFGRLIVTKFSHKGNSYRKYWECKCECGNSTVVLQSNLRDGNTKSCGCLNQEKRFNNNRAHKHGHTSDGRLTSTYQSWQAMIKRCTNPNAPDYHNYGGRGIKVCDRWLKFENFLVDMGQKSCSKYQIDRINSNGNYEPKNCRWATSKENNRNKKNNHLLTHNGKTKCIAEWAEELGVDYHILHRRIVRDKWPIQKALFTPKGKYGQK